MVPARHGRLGLELPAVRLDDLPRERQPQPGAALLGGEEGLEEPRPRLARHARPGVRHAHLDHAVLGVRRHGERAALDHRLAAVAHQVHEDLPQLPLVGEHLELRRLEVAHHLHLRALQLLPGEVEHALEHAHHVLRAQGRVRQARQAQVVLGDLGEPVDLAGDRGEQLLRLLGLALGRRTCALASCSSSISTLRPMEESGLRISWATCAETRPTAASRSARTSSSCFCGQLRLALLERPRPWRRTRGPARRSRRRPARPAARCSRRGRCAPRRR